MREARRRARGTDSHVRLLQSPACTSYQMTPQGHRPPPKINPDNYGMDLNSDDSTDDEAHPRKPIPTWARGKQGSEFLRRPRSSLVTSWILDIVACQLWVPGGSCTHELATRPTSLWWTLGCARGGRALYSQWAYLRTSWGRWGAPLFSRNELNYGWLPAGLVLAVSAWLCAPPLEPYPMGQLEVDPNKQLRVGVTPRWANRF